jgi:hypothetical protein
MPLSRLLNILLSLLVTLALAGVSPAATPNSPEEPPIAITTCGTVISAPGTYTLGLGLTCTGDGVDITSSDVTFDLNGYYFFAPCISGCSPTQTAVKVYDPAGGIISNVNVIGGGGSSDYAIGVSLAGAKDSQVTGLSIANDYGVCMLVTASASGHPSLHDVISANVFGFCTVAGIQANSMYSSNVIGNMCDGFGTLYLGVGIQLLDGNDNLFVGNNCTGFSTGIEVGGTGSIGAVHNTFIGNVAKYNQTGIAVSTGADGNRFTGNGAFFNVSQDVNEGNASCGSDIWTRNAFQTANDTCIH